MGTGLHSEQLLLLEHGHHTRMQQTTQGLCPTSSSSTPSPPKSAWHASAESQKRLHRCFGRQPPRCPHRPCSVSPGSGTAQHLGDSSSAAHSRTSFCPRAAAEGLHPHCSRPPRTRHGQQSQHRAGRPRLPLCLPGPGPVSHVLPGARQLSHRRSVLEARGPSAARPHG